MRDVWWVCGGTWAAYKVEQKLMITIKLKLDVCIIGKYVLKQTTKKSKSFPTHFLVVNILNKNDMKYDINSSRNKRVMGRTRICKHKQTDRKNDFYIP